jgi:sugar fermentation stimulation protein A
MKYANIHRGEFLTRPNRFIAHVNINGQEEICHVKNTGRCKELLIPGCTVWVTKSDNPLRKTKYDLIAVQKGSRLINMDSQVPNKAAEEWLRAGGLKGLTLLRPETRFENSRFDFYFEQKTVKGFLEVKGVTLEDNGIVRFPDAPTQRGVKHLQELVDCRKKGFSSYVLFVIQMEGVKRFEPNWDTHPAFGEALITAQNAGVHILAYDCKVTPDSLTINHKVQVKL